MDTVWIISAILFLIMMVSLYRYVSEQKEHFHSSIGGFNGISMASLSTQALDSAPTTSEVKNHYKALLIYANDDIRKQGTCGLRILADFRDRVYGKRDFRDNLIADDFLANWPKWLPPMDPTIEEPIPDSTVAVTAESQMLAYLQKNFPQESEVDEQTGSTLRNLIEDFAYRFVFKKGKETMQVGPDFLRYPLLKGWRNPC